MPHDSSDPTDRLKASGGPSEFTQIFGKALAPEAHSPVAPETASNAREPAPKSFDQMFAAKPESMQTSSKPFREADSSEAPTQIFAAIPQAARPAPETFATDETRIFSHPAGSTVARPESSSVVATPMPPAAASEFTSVFQPIALPPAMPAPPAAPAAGTNSGEFTQFFSAVSARAGGAEQHAAPAAAVPTAAPPIQQAAKPPAPQPQSGEFTQLFQQQQQAPKPLAKTDAPAAQPVIGRAQEQSEAGSFTQLFSQPAIPASPLVPPAGSSMSPRVTEAATPPASHPIFGAPAPRGSFTDIFSSSPIAQPPAASADTRLADLFGGPSAPVFSPEQQAKPAPPLPTFGAPVPAAPPAPLSTAPGEFTQLMQALERPASAAPAAGAHLPVDAAFFAATPASNAGESEYTRVMRGGSAASPTRPPVATPAGGSAAAPGLALAPAAKDESAKDKPAKEKPKLFVILLVVMNVLLVLALIIIGFVLLHRR